MGFFSFDKRPPVTGQELVNMYMTVVTNTLTAETALAHAAESEASTMQAIASSGIAMKNLLHDERPLSDTEQNQLLHDSLDAHVKRVQADQLHSFSQQQFENLESEAIKKFK